MVAFGELRLKQEDCKSEATLICSIRACLKTKATKKPHKMKPPPKKAQMTTLVFILPQQKTKQNKIQGKTNQRVKTLGVGQPS